MSCSRHNSFYKAVDGNWYMELAHEEHGRQEDADVYGPFASLEAAEQFRRDGFSNPGGYWDDDSGTQPVPTHGPNGNKLIAPTRRRW